MDWAKTTTSAAIIIAAAIWASGCASTETEYSETSEGVTVTESSGAARTEAMDEVVIPLHEEELKVGTRTVDAGHVTIRKVVTSETVNQPVELRKETIVIERRDAGSISEPAGAAPSDATSQAGGFAPFEEGEVTLRLQREEPVVEKTTVPRGEVVAKRNVEWDKQTIQRDVRREDISVDHAGDISVSEDINMDAPGAERAEPAEADDESELSDD